MNITTAYNITRPIGAPAVDGMEAEEQIYLRIMAIDQMVPLHRLCDALDAGRRVFAVSHDLRSAMNAVNRVMEVN